jgi:large subunit ribosomal protein L24
MSQWLKKGDTVLVIAGNDKGRTGKILGFKKGRVLVQGINIRKKHRKKTQEDKEGQIIDIECPIDRSNLAICTEEGKKLSLKVKYTENREKHLVYIDQDKEVMYRKIK